LSITVFEHISDINAWVEERHKQDKSVGFVPTMGALHAGHQSLIALAKEQCDCVVASIFVNPTQFNNPSDLEKYPRTPELDLQKLSATGCHAVFCPSIDEMYPNSEKGHWDFGVLSNSLEGYFRPGHFDGVLTIVKKLFAAVPADRAFFGEKDFQQLALIRRLTEVERLPIEIVAAPTIREDSGLAMSSRNIRLDANQMKTATSISRILFKAAENARTHNPVDLVNIALGEFAAIPEIKLEYFALVVASSFEPVTHWPKEPCVFLVACYVGDVRLIDNVIVR
jgi:pantoate--beta-alanine ligase